MARILRAPDRLSNAEKKAATTLYLAGPFDDDPQGGGGAGGAGAGDASSWRDRVIAAVGDLDVVVVDPRSDRWAELEVGSPGRRGAYDWQCTWGFDADVVVVWVPAGSHDPTALLLLGYLGAKRSSAAKGSSVVVAGEAWDGLARVFAQNQRLFVLDEDLDEVIRIARIQLGEVLAAKRGS